MQPRAIRALCETTPGFMAIASSKKRSNEIIIDNWIEIRNLMQLGNGLQPSAYVEIAAVNGQTVLCAITAVLET